MLRTVRTLWQNTEGAVAPTVALSMIGLIVAGGIAFDYAQVASLDTELQNAADQAALAAASQLDGQAGACERAVAAARELISNSTLIANDGNAAGAKVAIAAPGVCGSDTSITFDAAASIRFYKDEAKATPSDDDSNAKFVEVTVDPRKVNYALTPIVGAISSPNLRATAFAGLREAICNTPPVMICNPAEPVGNTDKNYGFAAGTLQGKGLLLVSVGDGSGGWAPGNFGYLQTSSDVSNPILQLKQALGWTNVPGNCQPSTGVDTRTGANTPVTHALNTRFDMDENGGPGGGACASGGSCPPSVNTVKDLVRKANAGNCGQSWEDPSSYYAPTSATADITTFPEAMGLPRDKCHAIDVGVTGACEKIGDGNWDRNAYFRVNYGCTTSAQWQNALAYGATPTRYQVYKWEIDHKGETLCSQTVGGARIVSGAGANAVTDYDSPVCLPPGLAPSSTAPDRRRISAAVVNCQANGVKGNSQDVPVIQWIDLFLVEPSFRRQRNAPQRATGQQDVYVEVVESTTAASNASLQVVKKAVPYLIE